MIDVPRMFAILRRGARIWMCGMANRCNPIDDNPASRRLMASGPFGGKRVNALSPGVTLLYFAQANVLTKDGVHKLVGSLALLNPLENRPVLFLH